MLKYGVKWLRIVLSFVLAAGVLALLLGLLAGPAWIVHALSGAATALVAQEAPGDEGQQTPVDPTPPELEALAMPRPPLVLDLEFELAPQVLHVCASGCPYTTVQGAVDAARSGDLILVAEGTYNDHDGNDYVVEITKTVTLRGGYTTTNWTTPDINAHPTILDGQNSARVIRVSGDAAPTIEGFVIRRGATEVGGNGGGIYVAGGDPTIARCRIEDNAASYSGGGFYVAGGTPLIENCLIVGNEATQTRGGGGYVAGGFPTIRYSVFYQNTASQQGGGLYVADGAVTVVGVIFSGNTASDGGGVYAAGGALFFSHNGYWNNSPTHIGGSLTLGGDDLEDINPSFVNPGAGDFHLGIGSAYVDAGDPGSYPAVDYDGVGRFMGTGPDIGAYESYGGTCFARAGERQIRDSVNAAIADAAPGDVVKVAGVCTGAGTGAVVTVTEQITLRGGYTLTNWTDPDPALYPSIIDGEGARRGIHVEQVDAVIEGLHIRNGSHTGGGAGIYIAGGSAVTVRDNEIESNVIPPTGIGGGGIYVSNGSGVIIQNNDIHGNEIYVPTDNDGRGGAGILVFSGAALIEGNEIHDNTTHGIGGGGIYVVGGSSTIRRNHVYNNTQMDGNNGGGGIYILDGTAIIEQNNIHDNQTVASYTPSGGGGIYVHNGSSTIRNNLIYGNNASGSNRGGGLFVYSAVPTVNGNTFYENAAQMGGAAFLNGTATVITNSIVASNTATTWAGVDGLCDYCVVFNNNNSVPATNSYNADPQFVDAAGGDFHIESTSPARDSGGTPYPEEDYDGYARPFNAAADIGAFEFYSGNCFARIGAGAVYPTVQQAIDAAGPGDPILVAGHCTASGTPLAVIDKELTLEGGYTLTNWLTPTTQTILDGGGSQRVIVIDINISTERVVVDGFIVRGGRTTAAGAGAGLQVLNTGDIGVRNVVFYANTATAGDGAIVAVGIGNANLYNNTFVYNTAADVIKAPVTTVVSNTIIVSNTSDTINGPASCAYCFVGGDPMFVDPLAGDFHLQSASPCVFAGDPNTDLDHDWEGDPRPLGAGYDIGADQCAFFPGLEFAPSGLTSLTGAPGRPTIHTHYLTNTGGIADTYELTHSIVYSGGTGWAVTYDRFLSLDSTESAPVPVGVQVPPDAISGSVATVYVTATSAVNPLLYKVVTNATYINWNPAVTVTPVYSEFLNPGDVITYLHTLHNLGNAPDSFTLTVSSEPGGWAGITPTTVANLAPGASASIWMSVTVPRTMPGGVTETVVISVVNWSLDAQAVITDEFAVNHVTGNRFVDGASGNDTLNNCLVIDRPCRSVGYATGQAVAGDAVRVAEGIYYEHDVLLNKAILLVGGWSTDSQNEAWWGRLIPQPDPERHPTIVDAGDLGRVFEILGDPTIEGLTLRNGTTAGSGGGVYISSGSPLLRNVRILSNSAAASGGGIYNSMGTPTIERCWIGHNTAFWGAGFATGGGAPRFWNNVVFKNTASGASAYGGGIYVSGGAALIWHDTLYGNAAVRGGGIYVGAGSVAISNTIVVSNTAPPGGGGGVYVNVPPAAVVLGYNDVWGNVNGDYAGVTAGPNSVAVNPGFISLSGDDYHLAPNSPVADIAAASTISGDLDGEARLVGDGPDIGADEFAWGVIYFTPSYSGIVTHCESISYTHIISHSGHYTDTILFDHSTDQGLIVTVEPPQVTLGYRVTRPITVEVAVPCAMLAVVKDTTLVTASLSAYSFVSATVTDTNYVNVVPRLGFQPNRNVYTVPGTVYYTHTLTNLGNYTDTITYTVSSPFNWGITVLEPLVVLGAGRSRVVTVMLDIPSNVVSGTVHVMSITANSIYSWVVQGWPITATVVDTTTIGPRPAVDVQRAALWTGLCIDPKSSFPFGPYPYRVWNNGNMTDTIDLNAATLVDHGFPITITHYPFRLIDEITPPVVFTPTTAEEFLVWVEVPPTTPYGVMDTLYLTATSGFDPDVTDSDWYSLTTIQMDLAVLESVTQTFFLEPEIGYPHTFTYSETFIDEPQNWVDATLCEGSRLPDRWTFATSGLVHINEGDIGSIAITIGVPMDVYTATNVPVCIDLHTRDTCHTIARVTDHITVTRPHVVLEPDRFEEKAIPGTVMTYTFSLSNTGEFDDNYTLTWQFTRPPTYTDWTVFITPTAGLDLNAHEGLTLTAVMTVPAGVRMDEQARLVITATSSYTDAIFDTATTHWIVPSLPMAEIEPDNMGAAYPGTVISYTHVLTNVGNRTGVFTLTTGGSFATAVVSPTEIVLEPMESYTQVVVWVTIPPYAEIGSVDDMQVIVSFIRDEEIEGDLLQVVAHDWTTVLPVSGTRYVEPGGSDEGNNCLYFNNPQPCATIQHAIAQAAPGDEILIASGHYTDLHAFIAGSETVTQVVYLDKSVTLRGGYTHPVWDASDPAGNPSILDAQGEGRVIYVVDGVTPTISSLNLTGGYIEGDGAGLYIASGAVPTVELNVIEGNDAEGIGMNGGGIYYDGPGGLVLRQNTLRDNTAENGSGAYLIGVNAAMWNNVFDTNTARGLGGGLYLLGGSPAVWNNTFFRNSATRGGGLYYLGTGAPSISNTILAWNEATVVGGGIYIAGATATPRIDYNDYWNNLNGDVNGDPPGLVIGTNSLAVDPMFVDIGTRDLHLTAESPCVDRADPQTLVDRDRDDKPRPLLAGYDIGAYEYGLVFSKAGPVYVRPGETIQYTIVVTNLAPLDQNNVLVTDTLDPALDWIGPLVPPGGEYLPASRTVSWTVSISGNSALQLSFTARVTDNLAIGAQFSNTAWVDGWTSNVVTSEYRTCWVRLNDDPTDYATVQAAVDDSASPDDVVKVAGTCVDVNAYGGLGQVLYLSKTLTLRGGYTPLNWDTPDPAANPATLDALGLGRALYIAGDVQPTIEGLILTGGDAAGLGGLSSDAGGSVYIVTATVTLARSIVSGGQATLGGGLCLVSGTLHMVNSVVADNVATSGGGLYVAAGWADVLHTTFARNTGGGMFLTDYGSITSTAAITNVIMAYQSPDLAVNVASAASIDGVLWESAGEVVGGGLTAVINDLVGNPDFAADGYHLNASSAAIDHDGTDTGLNVDIDGDPRPWNGLPDLGADELALSMEVLKTASADPVQTGAPFNYTIYVTNTGGVALGLTITDTLPSQVEVDPAQQLIWTGIVLGPGATWVQVVPVTATAGYSGTLINQVDVAAVEGLTEIYVLTTHAVGTPGVDVIKTVTPTVAQAGDVVTYTIYVTNTGDLNLTATVVDTPPAQVSPNIEVTWTLPLLAPGATWSTTLTATTQFGYAGPLANLVRVTTAEGAADTYTALSTVGVTPGVTVTKSADPSPVLAGDPLTYTIYVTNTGNVTLTATIVDSLPDNVTPGGTQTWNVILGEATPTWSTTLVVTPNVGYAGTLTNVIEVDTVQGVYAAYTLTTQSLVEPRVEIAKVADPAPVAAGELLTYTIQVTNTGNVPLTAVITDHLPANTTHVTATNVLTWTSVPLAPDEVRTLTFTVRANWGYSGTLVNWVEVNTAQGAYDVYTLTTQALTTRGVTVTKSADPSPVLAGDPLTYTIYVTNTGNVTLTATIVDSLPDNVTPGGTQIWNVILGEATPTWSTTLVVVPDLIYAGLLTNVVEVGTVQGVGGVYTLTTESLVMAAVTVTKVAEPDPVPAGGTLTYTIRVENSGNITYSATVTDYLPAHTTHPTATTELIWSIPELGIHEVWQEQVVLAVEWGYSGTLSNMVEVTTDHEVNATWLTTSRAVVTPSLAGLKVVEPAVVPAGEVLTYTIYLTNTGNVTLTASITDLIPAHTSHVTGADELTWNYEFGRDGTWSQWFTVTVDAGFPGTVTNQVEVVAVEGATGVYTASALSLAPAVSITKQSDPPVVQAGETLTYTIYVTNSGTVLLDGIMVTDTLPAQVSTAGQTTWSVPPLPPLDPNGVWSTTLLVDVAWGYSGTLINQVDVSTNQGVTDTWVDTAYAEVTPALAVDKVAEESEVLAGGVVTYTIYVTNTGNVTLTVAITDHLPAHATHITATGEIVWAAELASPGAAWSQVITVTGEDGYAGLLENVVEVVAAEGVSQTVTETVTSLAPYLEVSKAVDPALVQAGDPLTYTITVTNTGTMVLNMTVTDTLPAQVQPNSPLVWTPLPLAPGAVWTMQVPVMVELGYSGTLTNYVEVSSLEGAAGSYELISLAAVTPAVTVTKQADPFWVEPGSGLVYTIYVTNTGNVTLTAWITDWLPVQVTPGGEQNWALELPPRQAQTIVVPVTGMSGYVGPLVNVVRVDTAEGVWAVYTETSQSCTPLATLNLAGPPAGAPGANLAFTATLTPPTTTMPVTYTWEAEGQTTLVHVSSAAQDLATFNWPVAGTYAITLTAVNGCGSTLQRTQQVVVSSCPFGVAGVTISGTTAGQVNIVYTLSALVNPANATLPVTYNWSPAPLSGQGTANVTYRWSTVGTYNVTVNASNCGGTANDVHSIVISPPCVGLTGVTIEGSSIGYTQTLYTFTARLSPANASSQGLTYVWSPPPLSGQGTANATYRWATLGSQTISVQVTNCSGTANDNHIITIQALSPIYLPLVMRDYRYLPDLQVVSIQTIWGAGSTPDEVRVTIRNNGPAPVVTDFWVDLYLDPSRVPVVGQTWNELCSQGKAWLVRSPNLQPGGLLVLRTSDPDDPNSPGTRYSIWPDKLPTGAHWLYAQVDSYWRPAGLIQELNETNNVTGQAYTHAAIGGVPLPTPLPELPLEGTPEPALPPEPRPTPEVRPTATPLP